MSTIVQRGEWEYCAKTTEIYYGESLADALSRYEADGWQPVEITHTVSSMYTWADILLMRPIKGDKGQLETTCRR